MKRLGWLFAYLTLGLFLMAGAANAVRVTALYQGVVPVASQSSADRDRMLQPALQQVFVKVSGSNQVLNNPTLKSRLSSASTLMQEFSYTPAPSFIAATTPYLLHINFDPDGVNKILRDAGVPIWGQNRPLLLVWLDFETVNHKAEIIGANSSSDISVILKQNMDRRGVPVIFPAMDMQDISQVTVNDVATMDLLKLSTAAKRYGSDAILVGRITQDEKGYNTQWKLIMGTDQWSWNLSGKALVDSFAALADNIADTLAGRYAAVMTNDAQIKLTLKVVGITQSDDFNQVMNYVKHVTAVTNVEVAHVTENEITLDVSLRGTENAFVQAVSIGQKLTPVPSENKAMLVFQWNH
jgi:hypothetical protein